MLSILLLLSVATLVSGEASLSQKVSQLNTLSSNSQKVIELDGTVYKSLVQEPRNYSTLVVLTALGQQFDCKPCQ